LLVQTVLNDLSLFSRYLEGVIQFRHDEDTRELFDNSRNSLIHLKTIVFAVDSIVQEEKQKKNLLVSAGPGISQTNQNAAQQQAEQMFDSRRIVNDFSEYWSYVYSQSRWKGMEEGLLVFLLDLFEEVRRRNWHLQEQPSSMKVEFNA
jgi:hypothetical protein